MTISLSPQMAHSLQSESRLSAVDDLAPNSPILLPYCVLDGDICPLAKATISPMNRSFLFGDSVYEVLSLYGDKLRAPNAHINRLQTNLAEMRIQVDQSAEELLQILNKLIESNRVSLDQEQRYSVYFQVARGGGDTRAYTEDFSALKSFIYAHIQSVPAAKDMKLISTTVLDDIRWDIVSTKSNSLSAAVLLKLRAEEQGFDDAILHRSGTLTEATSSNLFLVKDGQVCTPPQSPHIVCGITRKILLQAYANAGKPCAEIPLTLKDLTAADEVWLTGTNRELQRVHRIDDRTLESHQHFDTACALFEAELPNHLT